MSELTSDAELRIRARLAWNGWPDTAESRRIIAEHEARDKVSADAWNRVLESVRRSGVEPEPVAWVQRAALVELTKHKTATTTVCSGLLKRPFGDCVALYTPPPADAGMREALEPFAREADNWADSVSDDHRSLCTEAGSTTAHPGSETAFTVGDLRRAKAALTAPGATTKSDGGTE